MSLTCGKDCPPIECNRSVSFCATSILPKGWKPFQVSEESFVGGFTFTCDLQCSVQPCIFKTPISNLPNPCGPDAPPITCMADVVLNRFFLIGALNVVINVAITPEQKCRGVKSECGFGKCARVSYTSKEICIPINNLICVSCNCDCESAFPCGFIQGCSIDSIIAGTTTCNEDTISLSGTITFKMCSN
jgi:hypothetical protein